MSSSTTYKQLQSITATVASNALTLGLNSTTLDFRSTTLTNGVPNTRTVSGALSLWCQAVPHWAPHQHRPRG